MNKIIIILLVLLIGGCSSTGGPASLHKSNDVQKLKDLINNQNKIIQILETKIKLLEGKLAES
jgi:hypothetical protein